MCCLRRVVALGGAYVLETQSLLLTGFRPCFASQSNCLLLAFKTYVFQIVLAARLDLD